jgi:ceramide glucosyltransferase
MVKMVLILLVVISWFYWLAALLLVYRFFHNEEESGGFAPPVSILKPVKGLDTDAYQNFASFCQQDYPEYELLFGLAEACDPALPLLERLRGDFPERDIRLIISEPIGTNRKASLLHRLQQEARHDILVASDSDMRVTPDYLHRVVAPLADEEIGLVTCPYRGNEPETLTAGLEILHMGVSFLPAVILARSIIKMRFAMGASVTLRRRDLAKIGGFAALANYLADDYLLGARISGLGLKVHLSRYIMTCILGATTFRKQWDREVRWMRCARISRPREYPGWLFSFTTPLALALLVATGFESLAVQLLLLSLLWRWVAAWLISGQTGDSESRRWLIWLPLRDILSATTWLVGGLGRRIVWRDEVFTLQDDGRMKPLSQTGGQSHEGKHIW